MTLGVSRVGVRHPRCRKLAFETKAGFRANGCVPYFAGVQSPHWQSQPHSIQIIFRRRCKSHILFDRINFLHLPPRRSNQTQNCCVRFLLCAVPFRCVQGHCFLPLIFLEATGVSQQQEKSLRDNAIDAGAMLHLFSLSARAGPPHSLNKIYAGIMSYMHHA